MSKVGTNLVLVFLVAAGWLGDGNSSAAQYGPPAKRDDFSPTDRTRTEKWLAEIQQRLIAIAREPNPVVRKDKQTEVLRTLKRLEGQIVTWSFPTRFSSDGKGIEIAAPRDRKRGIYYNIATTDYFSFLVPQRTTPRLLLERDIDRNSFRRLRGGEPVKVKGVMQSFTPEIQIVGRIVEDPFGRPVLARGQFQPRSEWSGRCVLANGRAYAIKLTVTQQRGNTFAGTCVDIKGFVAYPMSGTLKGKDIEFRISPRPGDREQFPYLTTFRGTFTDGFMVRGTFDKGRFMLFLHE